MSELERPWEVIWTQRGRHWLKVWPQLVLEACSPVSFFCELLREMVNHRAWSRGASWCRGLGIMATLDRLVLGAKGESACDLGKRRPAWS